MFPARFAPVLFSLIVSCLMSGIVSAVATLRAIDPEQAVLGAWLGAWGLSWLVAFPCILVLAPLTRKIVTKLVRPEE